ncbi:frizzled-4-like [Uloborus diversus]|uniref:frizzled-4-like n=1 Tax=Uloborus diversus TaxID=327109 RepID=UPI00240A1780|nr:frizzled-4-like [Uloborus diversus]
MLCKILAFILLQFSLVHCSTDIFVSRTCERITIEQCRNIGYNVTGMPNFLGHDRQMDVELIIESFVPLIQYGCSSRLRFFLCSAYVPMCSEKVPQLIGPCRPLCESVQELCEPVLKEFGFPWPPSLNCSQFPPENNLKDMCMDGPEYEEKKTNPFRERNNPHSGIQRGSGGYVSHSESHFRVPSVQAILRCKHLHSADLYYYLNHTGRCVPTCYADILYSKDNKDFAQVWIATWSSFCFLSCLFTITFFFTNSAYFKYPDRIVVVLSLCYLLYSFGFFIRLMGGRNNTSCYSDIHYKEPLLVQHGLDNINCNTVFTLLYFFHMASNVWWVILSISWFLTAGLKWTVETVGSYGTYFHLIAWSVPALKTIAILVLRAVDADELSGTCYVGNHDPDFLLRFVLIPSFTYLILSVTFLLAGMITAFRNHKLKSRNTSSEEKRELLKLRTGVFAILYTVPATCILVANCYEYSYKDQWLAIHSEVRPNVEIFTLKIFMSLVVGFAIGVWLWISQTHFFRRRNCGSTFCARSKDLTTGVSENRAMLLGERKSHKMTVV